MKFNTESLAGFYVKSADLKVYQYKPTAAGSQYLYWGQVTEPWFSSTTWNSNNPSFAAKGYVTPPTSADWVTIPCDSVVQSWVSSTTTNYGFSLYQSSGDSTTYREFRSQNYAGYHPTLAVVYTDANPVGTTVDKSVYRIGDTVTANVSIAATDCIDDINTVDVGVNYLKTDGSSGPNSRTRGYFRWDKDTMVSPWDSAACAGTEGGNVGATTVSTYNPSTVTLLKDQCSTARSGGRLMLTLKWQVNANYGDIQDNDLDVFIRMGPTDTTDTWNSGWAKVDTNFDMAPTDLARSIVATTYASNAAGSWFAETDANGDGVADNKNDSNSTGRGSVNLSWGAVAGAAAYDIELWDGAAYRRVATVASSTTTWTSANKGLFPKDSWIATNAAGLAAGTTNPFASPGGVDLRDDPRLLWAATPGTTYDGMLGYYFRVVPTLGTAGSGDLGSAEIVAVGLDDRTIGVYDDVRHTDVDLDESVGGALSLEADTGALQLDTTDLDIASYGPAASLSRHYSSGDAATSTLAPGWRFSFERTLATASASATYTDEAGDTHRFVKRSGVWVSPYGFTGTLSTTVTAQITWVSGEGITFDSQGRFASEYDSNANTVTCTYSAGDGNDIRLTAANGRYIDVARDGSNKVTGATQSAGGVTRTVDYTGLAGGSGTATVIFFAGQLSLEREIDYAYEGGRIAGISTPQDSRAVWGATYSGGLLAVLTSPATTDGTPVATITRASSGAQTKVTITRAGRVDGTEQEIEEHHYINPTGTEGTFVSAHVVGGPEPVSTSTYSPEGFEQSSTSADGSIDTVMLGVRGLVRRTRDERGAQTNTYYGALDRVTSSTDERDALTSYAYDTRGNCTSETADLNATENSLTLRSYDASGLVTAETVSLNATQTAVKNFVYDPSGQVGTETVLGVKLSPSASPISVVVRSLFDGFGQLTESIDASGVTTARNTYDAAGRLVSATDAPGVVTHTDYDALGRATSSWRSAAGTPVKADWSQSAYDGAGRMLTESRILSTGIDSTQTATSTASVVTHQYDRMGRETTSDDSKVSGMPALFLYDAAGNVRASWAEGVESYVSTAGAHATFDLAGREISRTEAGATAHSATDYFAGQLVATETASDGTWTTYVYDEVGNRVSETSSGEGGASTQTFLYDVGGRMTAETDADGVTTTHAFDLAGREVGAKGEGPASATVYNVRGETLSVTDADGVRTETTLDATGRTLKEQIIATGLLTRTTTTSYDAFGRTASTTDPDGLTTILGYDEFSRVASEISTSSAGERKHEASSFDSLGRAVATTDSVAGKVRIVRQFGYNADGSTVVTSTAGGVTTVLTVASNSAETTRQSFWAGGSLTATATSDGAGREIGWSIEGNASARGFDASGRLSSLSSPFGVIGLGYDDAGRQSRRTVNGVDTTFTYTDAGRLATVTAPTYTRGFVFDPAGNLTAEVSSETTVGMVYDAASQRLLSRSASGSVAAMYGFDAFGQRTSQGPVSNPTSETFRYTGTGRLASYATSSGVSATYEYDANGQRTSSVVDDGSTLTRTTWTYDGLQLLSLAAERSDGATWSVAYLYGSDGKPYAGVYRESGRADAVSFLVVADERGDVLALTDTAGREFASWGYDEWGVATASAYVATGSVDASLAAAIADRQPLRYAGYCYDTETSMYYCSARTYDPLTRQFLSKDPAKADGEESAYQYCGGNPVGKMDPRGLAEESVTYRFENVSIIGWVNRLWITVSWSWANGRCTLKKRSARGAARYYWTYEGIVSSAASENGRPYIDVKYKGKYYFEYEIAPGVFATATAYIRGKVRVNSGGSSSASTY